jgi:Spy/CpxP family protein refolding chaperone
MNRTNRILAGLTAAVALALAAPAFAHQGGGPGMGRGMHGGGMHGGMGMGPMNGPGGCVQGNTAAVAEGRLDTLKAELKITANQEAAWNTFAAKARTQAETRPALCEKLQANTTATAPERLALRAEAMKQRAAGMEGIAAGLKELYGALTPEQKAVMDSRFVKRGPGPMAWRGPQNPK